MVPGASHLLAGVASVLAARASNPRLECLPPAPAPPVGSVLGDAPWTLHVLDNPGYRLPNGLDAADADGDGRLDGDGDLDVVYVHGTEALTPCGVAVVLNPGGAAARDPVAWGAAR